MAWLICSLRITFDHMSTEVLTTAGLSWARMSKRWTLLRLWNSSSLLYLLLCRGIHWRRHEDDDDDEEVPVVIWYLTIYTRQLTVIYFLVQVFIALSFPFVSCFHNPSRHFTLLKPVTAYPGPQFIRHLISYKFTV